MRLRHKWYSSWTAAILAVLALTSTACERKQELPLKEKHSIVETAISAGGFETLVAALKAADLVETLEGEGPFTVFAPTDEAFDKLPAGTLENLLKPHSKSQLQAILTYHVVPGRAAAAEVTKMDSAKTVLGQSLTIKVKDGKVMVDGATVTQTDIDCSNGLIHVIDGVVMPKDIVDMAVAAGSFKTLVQALKAAGLVETLKGAGPFTVFAPTDAGFEKLPAGTLADLLKPENKDKLTSILTYHVAAGNLRAPDLAKMKSLKTVQGQELTLEAMHGKVSVDRASVVTPDIGCANGVIHVIDSVIMPK